MYSVFNLRLLYIFHCLPEFCGADFNIVVATEKKSLYLSKNILVLKILDITSPLHGVFIYAPCKKYGNSK